MSMKNIFSIVTNLIAVVIAFNVINNVEPGFQRVVVAALVLIYEYVSWGNIVSAKLATAYHITSSSRLTDIYEKQTRKKDESGRADIDSLRKLYEEAEQKNFVYIIAAGVITLYAFYKIVFPY